MDKKQIDKINVIRLSADLVQLIVKLIQCVNGHVR